MLFSGKHSWNGYVNLYATLVLVWGVNSLRGVCVILNVLNLV